MTPANSLIRVRQLATDEASCDFYSPVLEEFRNRNMDSDDLREIIASEIGEIHCYAVKPTERYYPATTSDYYSIWVDICCCDMFIKILIAVTDGVDRLVITSFKKDDRNV